MKNKPLYTKARHEVYQPDYIPKSLQLHHKCTWANKHHSNQESFFSAYVGVQKFIAGSETNGQCPNAYFSLRLGNYNSFRVNTRDFVAFNEAIQELAQWCDYNKEAIQQELEGQLLNYQEHQFKIFMLATQTHTDPTNPPQQP